MLRVGIRRHPGAKRCDVEFLDDLAVVHYRHPLAHVRDDGEVVGHQKERQAVLASQPLQQVEYLRLDRDIERRGRLVEQQDARLENERTRDRDPLSLAAGKLVGIAIAERRTQPDLVERALDPAIRIVEPMDRHRFAQDAIDRVARMERAIGILKHHLNFFVKFFAPARALHFSFDGDTAAPGSDQA